MAELIFDSVNDMFALQYKLNGVDAIVNPCNLVGAAGKGLSKEFQKRYSKNYAEYYRACKEHSIGIGENLVVKLQDKSNYSTPRFVINLATKNHYAENSRALFVERGLKCLVKNIKKYEIKTLIIPRLGCGLGNLNFDLTVRPLMVSYLKDPDIDCKIYVSADYKPTKIFKPVGFR